VTVQNDAVERSRIDLAIHYVAIHKAPKGRLRLKNAENLPGPCRAKLAWSGLRREQRGLGACPRSNLLSHLGFDDSVFS
jgi:hypothetical protein